MADTSTFSTVLRAASRRLALLALFLFAAGSAHAALGATDDEFLPVREAFRLTLERDDGAFIARWQIADGYYLYRDKLRFVLVDAAGQPLDALAPAEMPAGEEKQDEIFGLVRVFHHELSARLPVQKLPDATGATLRVTYQGCAEAGLCYAPETEEWPVDFTGMQPGAAGGPGTAPPADVPDLADAAAIEGFLGNASFLVVIGVFFVAGLLLSLTPCVWPMVPILSSIIVGEGQGISARRGFLLSLAYVLGMALTYSLAGVVAALLGKSLEMQLWLQSPPVLSAFAAVFVLLALSMFGFYELQMPAFLRDRLTAASHRQQGGNYLSVAIMGVLSALVVSPCVTAPLAGALGYISTTGNAVLGGSALFALSMGMGMPLLLIGATGGKLLLRAGPWMNGVKAAFGVVMLGVAVLLLERILPGAVILALWALLAMMSGIYLGALEALPPSATGWRTFRKGCGIVLVLYGAALGAGALAGGDDPLQPLAPFAGGAAPAAGTAGAHDLFTRAADSADLRAKLDAARAAGRPVLLDFYADWCKACRIMARDVFPDPQVQAALAGYTLLQVDMTADTEANKALLREYGVAGLPALLFFRPDGSEVEGQRILGEQDAPAFIDWLRTRIDPELQRSR